MMMMMTKHSKRMNAIKKRLPAIRIIINIDIQEVNNVAIDPWIEIIIQHIDDRGIIIIILMVEREVLTIENLAVMERNILFHGKHREMEMGVGDHHIIVLVIPVHLIQEKGQVEEVVEEEEGTAKVEGIRRDPSQVEPQMASREFAASRKLSFTDSVSTIYTHTHTCIYTDGQL